MGPVIDPTTGQYDDDSLIAKAFEALRVEFGNKLPPNFFGQQWERARLVLNVEGRSTANVFNAIRPFAVAQCSTTAIHERSEQETAERLLPEFPHMARMMKKGML